MKFKLLEKVLDVIVNSYCKQTYYIYVNPTSQELHSKEDSKGNRGIIDTNGDLYIEAMWSNDKDDFSWVGGEQKFSSWIHDDLLEHLHNKNKCLGLVEEEWYRDKESLNHGLCVQRKDDSFDFWVAESYDQWVTDFEEQRIGKFFELAKKKNPHLNFRGENIYYSDKYKHDEE